MKIELTRFWICVTKIFNYITKQEANMDRKEIVLAGLSPGGCELFSPVQVQKLFFLIDKNISESINGHPFFNFEPYNYGPFDKKVYITLDELAKDGLAEAVSCGSWTSYRLTNEGQKEGERLISSLSQEQRDYVASISQLVRKLSFSQLVSAIYKAYPEMKVNSAFQS